MNCHEAARLWSAPSCAADVAAGRPAERSDDGAVGRPGRRRGPWQATGLSTPGAFGKQGISGFMWYLVV
jgi:hypothetical protein